MRMWKSRPRWGRARAVLVLDEVDLQHSFLTKVVGIPSSFLVQKCRSLLFNFPNPFAPQHLQYYCMMCMRQRWGSSKQHIGGNMAWFGSVHLREKREKLKSACRPGLRRSTLRRLRVQHGAAFSHQVLTLQTLVQVLDGSLKGPGAASSGDQTRSVNDLIQDNFGTDKNFS